MIFFIAALAESNRPPFDLAEADAELVAGFHTEYGGMRYAMFANAEYIEAIVLAALGSVLFLGGWHGPVLPCPARSGCSISSCSSSSSSGSAPRSRACATTA